MIKRLIVKNLHGKFDYDLTFNEDINIITGRNGSGKTTLMKLIRYLVSGNTHLIFEEKIEFSYIKVEFLEGEDKKMTTVEIVVTENKNIDYIINDYQGKRIQHTTFEKAEETLKKFATSEFLSIFFPTFRRIEGGFGIGTTIRYDSFPNISEELKTNLQNHLHQFIFAISAQDIERLMIDKYADISQETNLLNTKQAEYILSLTQNSSEGVLPQIQQKVKETEAQKAELMMPITVLSDLLADVFDGKGVKITEHISIGKKDYTLPASKLSSGEKQMLSFLAYNAFYSHAVIFIDEPELSLHPDWQRKLVPMILKQNTGNQLFMATHSSAIASYYPEKEIWLDAQNKKGGVANAH